MQDEYQGPGTQVETDTACLAMLARFHRAASPEQLAHKHCQSNQLIAFNMLASRTTADYKSLMSKGILGKHAWLEKVPVRLDRERELLVQQARIQELLAAQHESERLQNSSQVQTRRRMFDWQHGAEQSVVALSLEPKKAEQRNRLTRLATPADGTVQQLAIYADGGVVTEAQPLKVIVPSDQPLEVEAMLENKDIGFVRPGQEVEIKVETFTSTKYGVMHGTVLSISNDAIEDERRGPIYSTRIQLKENSIKVCSKTVAQSPRHGGARGS